MRIVLTVGKEFSEINDVIPISRAFLLCSWIPEHYDVRILDKKPFQNGLFEYDVMIESTKFRIVEVYRDERQQVANSAKLILQEKSYIDRGLRETEIQLQDDWTPEKKAVYGQGELTEATQCFVRARLQYIIISSSSPNHQFPITVRFVTIGDFFILITIDDSGGFFKTLGFVSEEDRIPTMWPSKPKKVQEQQQAPYPNTLQFITQQNIESEATDALPTKQLFYPYIEPENVRLKSFNYDHFALAFQGGGAKGAAYVGAVQALKDLHPTYKFKSIIGSSVGGIIALALSAGCSWVRLVEHCKCMADIPQDVTIRSKAQGERLREKEIVTKALKDAIVNYGILPEKSRYILELILTDDFLEKLLELVSTFVDGIGQMFSFHDPNNPNERKTNYYGLLLAQLLKGRRSEDIILIILREFLASKNLTIPIPAEQLTMKQFYDLTEIQFTVTSVDLKDQILRFFNHKTTPDLPVCKAVVMTSSFPTAFKALKWEQRWGKYYIHYSRWRREIDLQGHQFTDGGMLANFPMMYLDNETMRPMYFSHQRNYKTSMAGFGLNEIPDQKEQELLNIKRKVLKEELAAMLKAKLPLHRKLYVAYTFLTAESARQLLPHEELKPQQIPLLDLGLKLLDTYKAAGDNLVKEWFWNDMIADSPYKTIGQMLERPLAESNEQINQILRDIGSQSKIHNKLLKQIRAIRKQLCSTHDVQKFVGSDFAHFRSYIRLVLRVLIGFKETERDELAFQDQTGYAQKIERLNQLIRAGKVELEKIEAQRTFGRVIRFYPAQECILNLGLGCNFILRYFPGAGRQMGRLMHQLLKPWFECPYRGLLNQDRQKLEYEFLRLKKYEDTEKMMFEKSEARIRAYIMGRIRRSEHPNIHLVFDGSGEHNMFSYQIFKLVEDCMFKHKSRKIHHLHKKAAQDITHTQGQPKDEGLILGAAQILAMHLDKVLRDGVMYLPNRRKTYDISEKDIQKLTQLKLDIEKEQKEAKQHYSITSITCSSMHCYLAFLLTTDMSPQRIEEELLDVKKDFSIDINRLINEYNNKDWSLPTKCRITKDFQNALWNQRKDLFSALELELGELDPTTIEAQQIHQKLKKIKEEFEQSRQTIFNSYDIVLERMLEHIQKHDSEELLHSLGKQMSLKFLHTNFFSESKRVLKQTTNFVSMLLSYFEEQIKHLVLLAHSESEIEIMQRNLTKQQQKDMWKCMIVSKFLACDKLKTRIQHTLAELSLPKKITLEAYYGCAPRKLELTFPAVDLSKKIMRFINHKTFPLMPVWAAVIIGCSLPMVFPTISLESHWCESIETNNSTRLIKTFFEDAHASPPVLTASNLLNSFPLDLITNKKVQEKIYQFSNHYTLLNFGVDKERSFTAKAEQPKPKYIRKYLSLWQLLKFALKSHPKQEFDFKKLFRAHILETYMLAHDNFVIHLYNEELLMLPVRVSTLSFSKFRDVNGKSNPTLLSMLDQTYFCTKEKYQGNNIYNQKNFTTYVQVRTK